MDHTCQQLSVNWEKIGGVLGISKTIIDIIAHSASAASMSKMLSSWLNRESPDQPLPTWKILCDAIAAVDRTAAEKIAADKGFTITHTGTIIMIIMYVLFRIKNYGSKFCDNCCEKCMHAGIANKCAEWHGQYIPNQIQFTWHLCINAKS